ncbi:MAG: hypothetical protein OEL86_17000 [Sulfuritalea sp.]|jgi:hypothetical protein|nr:hypothetical protein [Sulfuritalea sp.]
MSRKLLEFGHMLRDMDIHLVLSRTCPDAQKLMDQLEGIVKTLDAPKLLKGGAATNRRSVSASPPLAAPDQCVSERADISRR